MICPGCGFKFAKPEQLGAMTTEERDSWHRAALRCCNPACDAKWGTGCWHCHSPDYADDSDRIERATVAAVKRWAEARGWLVDVHDCDVHQTWQRLRADDVDHPRVGHHCQVDDRFMGLNRFFVRAGARERSLSPDAALLWALARGHRFEVGACRVCPTMQTSGPVMRLVVEDLRSRPGEWRTFVARPRLQGAANRMARRRQLERREMSRPLRLQRLAEVASRSRWALVQEQTTYEFRLACCQGTGRDVRDVGDMVLDVPPPSLAGNLKLLAADLTVFADAALQRGDEVLGVSIASWLAQARGWQPRAIWLLMQLVELRAQGDAAMVELLARG